MLWGFLLLALIEVNPAVGQVPSHKFPKLAIQQTWVESGQNSIVDIVARFDLLQVKMSPEQVQAVRQLNPNAIILPFDSMGEPRDKMPAIWNTSGKYTSERDIQDVTDQCPVYYGDGSYLNIPFDGKNFQEWKAEELVSWKGKGFDGVYVDLWYDWLYNPPPELTKDAYQKGMTHLAERMRTLWPDGIFIGNGASNLTHSFALNGYYYEDYPIFVWPFESIFQTIDLWKKNGTSPVMIIINQRSKGVNTPEDPSSTGEVKANFWKRARYAVTLSMLWDETYVMFDYGSGGSPHWANPWFLDEFEVNVGEPVGPMRAIQDRVYFREFTNGAVICNMSAHPVTVTASDLGGGVYYRFFGNQQPKFNNGQRFDQVELDGWAFQKDSNKPIGDGIILVKSPQVAVADIILDDAGFDRNDWGTSMAPANNICGEFHQTGFKYDGLKYQVWQDAWRIHGHNTCYFTDPGDRQAVATWTPIIGYPGKYEIFEWHPTDSRFTRNAQFTIYDRNGGHKVVVNQSRNGGRWNSLGVYSLSVGKSNRIELRNGGDGILVADAIKLVFRGQDSQDLTPPSPPKGVKVEIKGRK